MIKINYGKKIVLYGDERYIRDFLYVFHNIKPAYCINDYADGFAESITRLKEDNKKELFVIICKYDDLLASNKLEKMGYTYKEDYIYASDLFENLDFPIKEIGATKKIYVWGTGEKSHEFFHAYIDRRTDFDVTGCIDSDKAKKDCTFFRRPIYQPEDILSKDNIFVIVASTLYWSEIKKELLSYGKMEDVDFVHYTAINSWASWLMRETVYSIPRLDYVCPKPFQDACLMGEGRIMSCAGLANMTTWITPTYYKDFDSVWHSNILRIIRLSIINGTYSFCNSSKCNYLYRCGEQRELNTKEIHYKLHYGFNSPDGNDSNKEIQKYKREDVIDKEHYKIEEAHYPKTVMCSFDSTCNLHCSSCRPEVYAVQGKVKEQMEEYSNNMIRDVFQHVDRVKVAGDGEAFASDIYRGILFNKDVYSNVKKLGILSNGTLLRKSYVDKLVENYEEVKIFISMDGATGVTAEKLRKGINFEKWLDNMQYIASLRKKGKIDFLAFNFVVQRDNFREMPDFVKMCMSFNADQIKFSKIFNWGRFSQKEFERISMFDSSGKPKKELSKVIENEIFNNDKVNIFEWVDW